ncbi:hypothetical protein T265_04831 [Opisthorchis viverrini]|uniref:Uncharacterized protein n=1 Tax=Opisthorchis viverrini TaxID=6198 RepID=A0A074ZYB4_OPIVI|nr:hypothetical protein T265_04831 [Opisthorchis viverrini]KER28300.1 hypothetical protein T265_04831 [Opisthorchis viverrini]
METARGGQSVAWQRSMYVLISQLSCVGDRSLPGWKPRDNTNPWLVTLADIVVTQPVTVFHQSYHLVPYFKHRSVCRHCSDWAIASNELGQTDGIPALVLPSGGMAVRYLESVTDERFFRRLSLLVVDQVAVDLFAELSNWLANVSSPVEETSSVRG